ncbi:MAG: hypothetical protein NTX65_08255 [Ignavibacteriales bacterium]|nr:hypothetical protein [Ignavibacteriales bacterium]
MNALGNNMHKTKRLFGWIGLISLLLIIPVKAIRFVSESTSNTTLFNIIPSFLGPVGLLFLVLSGSGKLSRLTLPQVTLIVAIVAFGLEFLQLFPRTGILSYIYYTFDWLDLLASLVSVCIGYFAALLIMKMHNIL